MYSQDTIVNKEVEVIKAYQPSISEANKIYTSPKIVDTVRYTPVFDYKIESTLVPVTKSIQNLPYVELGNPPKVKENRGYIKAGFGNALTPYGEFFLNTKPSKTTDFGIQLYHFSSSPKVKLDNGFKIKSPYSDDLASFFVKNYFRRAVLDWNVQYKRNRYNYYGFPGTDTLLYNDTESYSNTLNKKQVLNNASTSFNLHNIDLHSNFLYDVTLGYHYFWNATGQKTHHGSYDGQYTISKRNYDIIIGSEFDYYYQDSILNPYTSDNSHQFMYAGLSPQISLGKSNWNLDAGFNLSAIIDNDTSAIFHISPKIYFEYRPIKDILSLYAGSDGQLQTNDYQSMMEKNRYLSFYDEVKPSQQIIKLYGGVKGKFSHNISFVFDVGYSINSNNPFYYLEQINYQGTSSLLSNLFDVKYADVNTLKFGGNIRYSSDNVTVSLKGNYYSYNSSDNITLTNMPSFDAGLDIMAQITNKIKCRVNTTVVGPRKAELEVKTYMIDPISQLYTAPVITTDIHDLKTIIDINAGADYLFRKNISFSLDVKNLLNQNYQIWDGYNTQGILFLVGARYTF